MKTSIFDAMFSERKGKSTICFDLCEVVDIPGHGFISVKGGKKTRYEVFITDEDDKELCRNEVRLFLNENNLVAENANNKFTIS